MKIVREMLTIFLSFFLFLCSKSLAYTTLELADLLDGSPHLEELFGSGDFKYNNNQVDSHYAFSFESLVRLFKIERDFVSDLRSLLKKVEETVEREDWETHLILGLTSPDVPDSEFLTGPPVSLYRIQTLHNISQSDLAQGRLTRDLPTSPHRLTWQDIGRRG